MKEDMLLNDLTVFMDTYREVFGNDFPIYYLKQKKTKELIEIIKECIEKEKDAFELGYVKLEDGMIY